ncbi:SBF1/SBF2 domain [Trinorchestia longiramus]|nr:SBF1/SBF2 domain [Trinorchestia longiramus]
MANLGGDTSNLAGNREDSTQPNTPSTAAANIGSSGIFLRSKLRYAISSSNDLFSSISNRLSLLSNPPDAPPRLPPTPPEQQQNLATREWVEGACACQGDGDPPSSPETTITKLKGKLKLENLQENLQELRPALEDFMAPDHWSDQSSTLPSNTPPYSPGIGERIRAALNPTIERKLEDYKAMAMRTLSGEPAPPLARGSEAGGGVRAKRPSQANCSIKVELVEDSCTPHGSKADQLESNREASGAEGQSVSVSSRSFNSQHSLHATGPDPFDKLKYKHTLSSGSVSDVGINSVSLDSTDSDPHKKLWIRDGSQTSLQSWASSLSYDSQTEEANNPRDLMRSFVECIFKAPDDISPEQNAHFADAAKTDSGRLWFARCINGKRCCRCVCDATFLALVRHFSLVLSECAAADDFSPAKSLMNMCFTYYHEPKSTARSGQTKEFLYVHLRQQPIWASLRFWNAAFFDALQCERTLRPVVTRQELETGSRDEAVKDELHYQENITFGQLGTFTCNMHAFGLSKDMVLEFLRKQVTIASLRCEQVQLLRDNVDRLYSELPEWQ